LPQHPVGTVFPRQQKEFRRTGLEAILTFQHQRINTAQMRSSATFH
jgi:hypothetical protein